MKNLTILKLNNFDLFFWKAKLGFNQDITLENYTDESLLKARSKSDLIILDFYFSRTSLDEEQSITINVMSDLFLAKQSIDLFILSPSYAGETILNLKKGKLKVQCHNFSGTILENICCKLNSNNELLKAS
jgi:hypothetical protein